MKKIYWLILILLLSLGGTAVLLRNTPFTLKIVAPTKRAIFSPTQREEIEKIIRNYLLNNLQLLNEVKSRLEAQEVAEHQAQLKKIEANILRQRKQVFSQNLPGRIVIGNSSADRTIVLFTQHTCSACKEAVALLEEVRLVYPELRLIIIYWPFLGEDAVYTAKSVLAAQQQGKGKLLEQLFNQQTNLLTRERVTQLIANQSEIEQSIFAQALADKSIMAGLLDNFKLAKELELIGTPTFIVANGDLTKIMLIPGYTKNCKQELLDALQYCTSESP